MRWSVPIGGPPCADAAQRFYGWSRISRVEIGMPLVATDLPGEVDAFGVRFMMKDWTGLVRCHVFRATIDHIEAEHARTPEDVLERFNKSRRRFESLASNLYDAGHRTPWISVVHLLAGLAPGSGDLDR